MVTDTTRRLLRIGVWSHRGSSRMRLSPVVDPALIAEHDLTPPAG
jgi:hypothetical protein